MEPYVRWCERTEGVSPPPIRLRGVLRTSLFWALNRIQIGYNRLDIGVGYFVRRLFLHASHRIAPFDRCLALSQRAIDAMAQRTLRFKNGLCGL